MGEARTDLRNAVKRKLSPSDWFSAEVIAPVNSHDSQARQVDLLRERKAGLAAGKYERQMQAMDEARDCEAIARHRVVTASELQYRSARPPMRSAPPLNLVLKDIWAEMAELPPDSSSGSDSDDDDDDDDAAAVTSQERRASAHRAAIAADTKYESKAKPYVPSTAGRYNGLGFPQGTLFTDKRMPKRAVRDRGVAFLGHGGWAYWDRHVLRAPGSFSPFPSTRVALSVFLCNERGGGLWSGVQAFTGHHACMRASTPRRRPSPVTRST